MWATRAEQTGELVGVIIGNPHMFSALKGGMVLPNLIELFDGEVAVAANALVSIAARKARDNFLLVSGGVGVIAVRKLTKDPTWSAPLTGCSAALLGHLTASPCNRKALLSRGLLRIVLDAIPRGSAATQEGMGHILTNLTDDLEPWRADPEAIKLTLYTTPGVFRSIVGMMDAARVQAAVVAMTGRLVLNIMQQPPKVVDSLPLAVHSEWTPAHLLGCVGVCLSVYLSLSVCVTARIAAHSWHSV